MVIDHLLRNQGEGGFIIPDQGMMLLSPPEEGGHGGSGQRYPPLGREELERMEQAAIDGSKDEERPAGDQGLPTVSNPGARGGCELRRRAPGG
jgi:hypothetical protein